LVELGFNSGWSEVTGMSSNTDDFDPEEDLVSFDGKGKYSDPKFEWRDTLGPTAVKFLNSDKLEAEYVNDIPIAIFIMLLIGCIISNQQSAVTSYE
jgi:hypothetical protein